MPPKSLPKNEPTRRICPWCSKEVAYPYLSLHKKLYCPMRPDRQEQVKAEAMGYDKIKQSGGASSKRVPEAHNGTTTPEASPVTNYDNIQKIELKEEYKNMVTIMKKKEETVDVGEEFQCGSCETTWHSKTKPKRCPNCDVEFA